MRIIFSEYDPENWTEGDEASLTHCAWHGQTDGRHSENCSVEVIWTVQIPDGRRFSACEKAGHDVLTHYGSKLSGRSA